MMKLKIFPYKREFPAVFRKRAKEISKILKNCQVEHIGSTAVQGLGGKGIIDILVGIDGWQEAKEVIKRLKNIGFTHIHPKENGRIFLSNKKETGLGDFHIHIVKKRSRQHKELLAFRDCLRKNKKEAKRYFELKIKWAKETGRDRGKYTKLKENYFRDFS